MTEVAFRHREGDCGATALHGRSLLSGFGLPCEKLDADSLENRQGRVERGIAVAAERAIGLRGRKPGPAGDFRHSLGASNDTQGMGYLARIVRFPGGTPEFGNGLIGVQVIGRTKDRKFFGHAPPVPLAA